MRRVVKHLLALSEREELLNELQALTGWEHDYLTQVTAGQHNESIRYVIESFKREGANS